MIAAGPARTVASETEGPEVRKATVGEERERVSACDCERARERVRTDGSIGDVCGRDGARSVGPGGETSGETTSETTVDGRRKSRSDGSVGRSDGELGSDGGSSGSHFKSGVSGNSGSGTGRARSEEGSREGHDGGGGERSVLGVGEGRVAVEEGEDGLVTSLDGEDRSGGGEVGRVVDARESDERGVSRCEGRVGGTVYDLRSSGSQVG